MLMKSKQQEPVHITGMAWTTPLGNDLEKVWQRLLAGETGIRPVATTARLRTNLAAMTDEPENADPDHRQFNLAVSTVSSALADAGVDPADPDVSIAFGTSYAGHLDSPGTTSLEDWSHRAAAAVGFRRTPVCITTACSAASDAVLLGADLIRAGLCQICVCGGVDVVTPAKRLGHSVLGTMSSGGLRAFDTSHDGMILGEGAAFLVLESPEHARERGAVARAVLRGAGSANDGTSMTAPDHTGRSVVLAVERCLLGSGLTLDDIDLISAHGTGTPVNDATEAASLATLFAGITPGPIVFGTKGALGHSLGACGTIEAISVILALMHGTTPPVVGLTGPMPEFPLPLSTLGSAAVAGEVGLSLTLGFGGFNTALLFSRGEGHGE
jgi:3-oxoacyl-[acyl-carrier-protein] synthase II